MGDEIVFNVSNGQVTEMPSTTLKDIGFKERADLQKWIEEYPEIVERDLLVVTTEFNQWELRAQRVEDRLDVLLLDSDGAPVVAELKRGETPDTVDLQALKYAAYCSQLTVELAPSLCPGQIVVMDDLGAHRLKRVRELIEERGCELLYVPAYSSEYNPIEKAFAKVKNLLYARPRQGPKRH